LAAVLVLTGQNARERNIKFFLRLPLLSVSAAAHPAVRNTTDQELLLECTKYKAKVVLQRGRKRLLGWAQPNLKKGEYLTLFVCN